MISADDLARKRAVLDACHDDPALFATAVLGKTLHAKQIDICDSVSSYPVTVVPAGRAVGKSFLLALIVLWWLYTRPYSQVITTGPDHRQVVTVLWKEIRRALRKRYDRRGRLVSPRIDLGYDHLTQGHGSPQVLKILDGTEWGALGFACKTDEGLSGQHAPELLLIVDEASGVKDNIWTAIYGAAAVRLVVVGNPIKYHCHFRELWELSAKSDTINGVHISSLDSPDASKETSPVGMASLSFLNQMREIHGEDSPWWSSNILGQFPGKETSAFIPITWLDACTRASILDDPAWLAAPEGPAWVGIDPAGGVGADRSVIVVRTDKRILEIFASEWYGLLDDARHRLEPKILEICRRHGIPGSHVVYDAAGVGRSLGSYLEAEGLAGAVGYFGSGNGGKLFVNRRTAVAFAFKNRLDARRAGHVPFRVDTAAVAEWPRLRKELREIRNPLLEYSEGTVKQQLEDKEALKARLKCSPDLSDALLMTYTFAD